MIKSEVKAVMKANYRVDKTHGVMKDKMVMTEEDIGKYLQEEWDTKVDEVYKSVKVDVSNQILAVFFTALHKDFGFGKKRLLKVKDSVESYFALMQTGIFNKPFSPIDCLNYLKEEFNIDLDKEDLIK